MKRITFWAKNNPRKSQVIITVGQFLLAFLGIKLGFLLFEMGFILPNWLKIGLPAALIFAISLYPTPFDFPQKRVFQKNRRVADLILMTIGIFLTIFFTQQVAKEEDLTNSVQFSDRKTDAFQKNELAQLAVYSTNQAFSEQTERIYLTKKKSKTPFIQKWMGKKIVQYFWKNNGKPRSEGDKALLVFLLILGIIGAEILLSMLACHIICSGMEALGAVIFFGGLTGLAALVAMGYRNIYPEMPRKWRITFALLLVFVPVLLFFLLAA
jgi:hypothetical protein